MEINNPIKDAEKNSFKLIRGQRGGYGFEIKVVSEDPDKLIPKAKELDKKAREAWIEDGLEELT